MKKRWKNNLELLHDQMTIVINITSTLTELLLPKQKSNTQKVIFSTKICVAEHNSGSVQDMRDIQKVKPNAMKTPMRDQVIVTSQACYPLCYHGSRDLYDQSSKSTAGCMDFIFFFKAASVLYLQ